MRVYLILFFLVVTVSYCVPRRIIQGNGGSSSQQDRQDRNGNEGSSSQSDRNRRSSSRSDRSGDGDFCTDNPNSQFCVCRENPSSSRCRDDSNDNSNNNFFRDRHDSLRDRFSGYVDLEDINESLVEDFLAGQSLNSGIRRARVYLDLNYEPTKNSNTYGGTVQLLFEPEDRDEDVESLNRNSLRHSSGEGDEVVFNQWYGNFKQNRGQLGFHGFFEDRRFGSIILSIYDVCEWSEGGVEEYSARGSVWYMRFKGLSGRNYNNCYRGGPYLGFGNGPSHPPKACWELGIGPYSCQAWAVGRTPEVHPVAGERSIEPTSSCYRKLGSFDRIDLNEVFNLDGDESFLREVRENCR